MLQASLFGAQDGNGLSLVYYFTLPEGWEPNDVGNPAALEMLQRFIHDGREQDKYAQLMQKPQQGIAAETHCVCDGSCSKVQCSLCVTLMLCSSTTDSQ